MAEQFSPTHFLLTNFLKEGAGISREVRTEASGLSIALSRFALQSPTLPPSPEDVARITRVHSIVHFANGEEYGGMVEKFLLEAEKKSLPVDPALEAALSRGSLYLDEERTRESTGLTIFPVGADRATAAIVRKPEGSITTDTFLNILAEEMIHAAAPQATFLRAVQQMSPQMSISPLDFFELVGRWVKFDFLEHHNPSLILPEEQQLVEVRNGLARQGIDFGAYKNLYLRGTYKR